MFFKIAIDAGHGNNTPGKRSPDGSMREFHFTNPTAIEVGKILKDRYDRVQILHPYDTTGNQDTPLITRTNKANSWGADVFVSVHANAMGAGGWNTARGIETFVYTSPSRMSELLAKNIQKQMIRFTGLIDRGVKKQNFAVVRDTKMPAALVECGFYTNQEELKLLKSAAFRKTCAEAIAAGIAQTFNLRLKAGASSPQPSKTDQEVMKLANELLETGSKALDDAVQNVLKSWEANAKTNPDGLTSIWREKAKKGQLTTAQSVALVFLAIDRGYLNLKG